MENAELFQGIDKRGIEAIMNCFKPETLSFKKGETIIVYSSELEHLCVLLSGIPLSLIAGSNFVQLSLVVMGMRNSLQICQVSGLNSSVSLI